MITFKQEIFGVSIGKFSAALLIRHMVRKLGLYCLLINLTLFGAMALPTNGHGQTKIGFVMPEKTKKVVIPFEMYNNLIVIPVTINKTLTLKFILDTGAESAILTEKLFGDLLGLEYVRQININAPGIEDSLQAFVATDILMELPGGIEGRGLNMLVLKEDYLELNKNLGEEVYGIIGYDVFSRFTVNINYDDYELTVYRPEHFKPRRNDAKIPMEIVNSKPYLHMKVMQKGKEDTVTLMVDSGASHAMLLDVDNTEEIIIPKEVITTSLGHGLAGEIPGFLGRMGSCSLEEFSFQEPLVSIPMSGSYMKAILRGSRQGTVGGDILSRLNTTFDYVNNTFYASKGNRYKESFEFNMSGMILSVVGESLDSIEVTRVRKESPADQAGIQSGDIIKKINGKNLYNSTFSSINALLRSKDGKKIRVVLWRGNKKMKLKFCLKRLI